jgi:hypothetical protein
MGTMSKRFALFEFEKRLAGLDLRKVFGIFRGNRFEQFQGNRIALKILGKRLALFPDGGVDLRGQEPGAQKQNQRENTQGDSSIFGRIIAYALHSS